MISTPITIFYTGILTFCYLYLSALVIMQRRRSRVGLGDGGDKHLLQLIRAHGNFSEYVPLALLLILVNELNTEFNLLQHLAGSALLLGRILHAYGLHHHMGISWQRVWGEALTFAVLVTMAGVNLFFLYASQLTSP